MPPQQDKWSQRSDSRMNDLFKLVQDIHETVSGVSSELRTGFAQCGKELPAVLPSLRSQHSKQMFEEANLQCENEYVGIAVVDASVQAGASPASTRQLRVNMSDAALPYRKQTLHFTY